MKLPARWKEASPVLDELLDMDLASRRDRLGRLREDDPELAGELQAMLDAVEHAARHSFLERRPTLDPSALPAGRKGMLIGAYRIEAELGRGGSGSVWRARRADGRFAGSVAIKLLHTALVGHHGVDRFHREGAILSRLAHNNIAHLLDAGVTVEGQPYLVLELVDGQPIDAYCDEHRLGVAERLRLLLDVMAAVRHAHARLIVHRDLKPSNILVTPEGQVKLLDFGIAKLLEGDLDEAPLTEAGHRVLTPRYAAPEQLEGGFISTATDVYALGVLMYWLLAGRYPTAAQASSAAAVITGTLNTEPAPLGAGLCGQAAESALDPKELAAQRGTDVKALQRLLRGDLNAIVMRALRKEPHERYESVAHFAADVERYLDGQPVKARKGSLGYRLGKLMRRHVIATTVTVLLVLSVIAGLVGTATQARQARREHDIAVHQLKGAEATRAFVQFLLSEGTGGEPVAPALLARGEALIEREFASDPEDQARLRLLLAKLYGEAGAQTQAEALIQKAAAGASSFGDAGLRREIQCQHAWQQADNGRHQQALAQFDATIAELRRAQGAADRSTLASCLYGRGETKNLTGALAGALADVQEALALVTPPRPDQLADAINMRARVASIQGKLGNAAMAAREFRAALAELEAIGRGQTQASRTLYNNLGVLYYNTGRPLDAVQAFDMAMSISRHVGHADPLIESNLARVLVEVGRFEEARALADHALASLAKVANSGLRAGIAYAGAPAWCATGDLRKCESLLRQARDVLEASPATDNGAMPNVRMRLGALLEQRGQAAAARSELQWAATAFEKFNHRMTPRAFALLARLDLALGDLPAALAHAQRAVQLASSRETGFPGTSLQGSALLSLGLVQKALGDEAQARQNLTAALLQLEEAAGPMAPETLKAKVALAH